MGRSRHTETHTQDRRTVGCWRRRRTQDTTGLLDGWFQLGVDCPETDLKAEEGLVEKHGKRNRIKLVSKVLMG